MQMQKKLKLRKIRRLHTHTHRNTHAYGDKTNECHIEIKTKLKIITAITLKKLN